MFACLNRFITFDSYDFAYTSGIYFRVFRPTWWRWGRGRGGARNQEEFWGSTHFARCATPAARWRFHKISIPAGNNGKNTWTVCVYIIMEKLYAVQGYGMYSVYWLMNNVDRLDYTPHKLGDGHSSLRFICVSHHFTNNWRFCGESHRFIPRVAVSYCQNDMSSWCMKDIERNEVLIVRSFTSCICCAVEVC